MVSYEFDNLLNSLIYNCVDVLVHGSDDDVRDVGKRLSDFNEFLDLIVKDFDSYILKMESEEKNA